MNFFKQEWVTIVGYTMLIVSIVILALAGYTKDELNSVMVAVFATIAAAGTAIVLVKKLIDKMKEVDKTE